MMKKSYLSDLLEGVFKTSEAIKLVTDSGLRPVRGPYSFSRLGNCPFKFKKQYIDKAQGLTLSRFGTNVGSAMHELCELDVQMRTQREPDAWLKVEDLVDFYLTNNDEYQQYSAELTEQLDLFRFNFTINKEYYVASEQALGANFDMSWSDYDEGWFRGKIDYLEINKHSGIARVVDFKNYPRIHTDAELNDIYNGVGGQLMGYVAMVMAMFPHVKSAMYEVYYTRFGVSRFSNTRNEYGHSEIRYISRDEVVRWWKFNQRKMLAFERREVFDPQPSQSECQYCPFIKQCPWFETNSENEYLAATHEKAREYASELIVLKEHEKRLKGALDEFTGALGPINLPSGEMYGYEEYEKVTIDPRVFFEVCKRAGVDVKPYVTISRTNAQKLKKKIEDKKLKDLLDEAFVTELKTRKVTPR